MKNKNRILTSVFVILAHLNTAHAWKVEKDGTTQMQLTNDGRLWVGADGANDKPKMAVTTTDTSEDRALDVRNDRGTGNNYGIVATAAGNDATMNVALYGWADNATDKNYGLYVARGYGYFTDDTADDWSRALSVFTPNVGENKRAGMITFGVADGAGQEAGHMSYVKTGTGTGYIDFTVAYGESDIVTMHQDGKVGIGTNNPSVALDVNGSIEYTGSITDVSDRRLKENIKPIKNSIKRLESLKGYTFNMIGDSKIQLGVMAQDVQIDSPEAVSVIDKEKGYLGVDYTQLVPVLIEAVKDLKQQNNALKKLVCQDYPDADICVE